MVQSKAHPDRSKIAIDHPVEVKYWSKHLGITPDELGQLVDKVGNSAAAVRKELRLGKMEFPRCPTVEPTAAVRTIAGE